MRNYQSRNDNIQSKIRMISSEECLLAIRKKEQTFYMFTAFNYIKYFIY